MKPYISIIIPFLLSLTCLLLYTVIGSEIDENGFVKEPFGLIPLGWLFFFVGLVSFFIFIIRKIGSNR